MGLWSKGIQRSKSGECREEDKKTGRIKEILEGQSEIKGICIIDPCEGIVDIDGSIEIYEDDLDNGELPFKVRKLTGNVILRCKKFKSSSLPSSWNGELIVDFMYLYNLESSK